MNNCIFLSWVDAKHHLSEYDQAEYSTFSAIEDALEYLMGAITISSKTCSKTQNEDEVLPDFVRVYNDSDTTRTTTATSATSGTAKRKGKEAIEDDGVDAVAVADAGVDVNGDDSVDAVAVDAVAQRPRQPNKRWTVMYEKLKEYRNKNGSFDIDKDDKENSRLRCWITEQKYQYKCFKLGQTHYISEVKRQLLMDIGFTFEFYRFDERLEQLREFKAKHGNLNVPLDDPLLGKWMEKQRRELVQYNKGKESKLDDEKVQQLQDVGVDVTNLKGSRRPLNQSKPSEETPKSIQKWEEMFEKLKEYKKSKNNTTCHVSISDKNNVSLHRWSVQQKNEYRKLRDNRHSRMTASRLQRLNDLGFVFNSRPITVSWEERMDKLREYKEKNGHLRIATRHPELGEFVSRMRAEYIKKKAGKSNCLNESRFKELTDIGFIFEGSKQLPALSNGRKNWDERFQAFLEFKETHGHTLVPQSHPTLGEWVHKQRRYYKQLKSGKQSSLTTERALKLADAGFVFDASAYRSKRRVEESSRAVAPQSPVMYEEYINNMDSM